jgi:ribose transport system permease protein
MARRLLSEYGMALVLLLLCLYFSCATWHEQFPTGDEAARQVVTAIRRQAAPGAGVLVVAQSNDEGQQFADAAGEQLAAAALTLSGRVVGEPSDLRAQVEEHLAEPPQFVAATREASQWRLVAQLAERFPALADTRVVAPESRYWPDFLKRSNLQAIVDRIVVIAIIAIGMTMVIITGGIDLSVGSLVALSAVVWTVMIRGLAGGTEAGGGAVVLCALGALALCAAVGAFSGLMVTRLEVPPFIVTLAMMLVASGLAFTLSAGQSVYEVPAAIDRLGRGSTLGGLPNTVLLMAALYAVAHLAMTRTPLGRSIYAVGGSSEAARLSGIPVRRVTVFVYLVCGLLAGLGGIVQASQLQSGAPTYGQVYELYVIAAVVVGGTSLAGGEGGILGTLIGALIIAVIQNGMNLTGVESYTQKVVLGLVILAAVVLDRAKQRGLAWRRTGGRRHSGGSTDRGLPPPRRDQ